MKKCAIYTRVSTSMQAEKEYNSYEAQRDKILSYIKRASILDGDLVNQSGKSAARMRAGAVNPTTPANTGGSILNLGSVG